MTIDKRSGLVLLLAALACADIATPAGGPPAQLDALSSTSDSGVVGAQQSALVVRATDGGGRAAPGATVTFAITRGNGSIDPRVAITGGDGQAHATWRLGTAAGANEVTVSVVGASLSVVFEAVAVPGPVASISITPSNARILNGSDSAVVTAQSLDNYGNITTPVPAVVVRDTTLIAFRVPGVAHALRRGGSTYLVATALTVSDSALVTVLAPGQSICTAVAVPLNLAIGQVVTDVSGDGACVHADSAGTEYAIIPFYRTTAASTLINVEVRGSGLGVFGAAAGASQSMRPSTPHLSAVSARRPGDAGIDRPIDNSFDLRLRRQARREWPTHAGGARAWYGQTASTSKDADGRTPTEGAERRREEQSQDRSPSRPSLALSVPAVGSLLRLNADPFYYCDTVDSRGHALANFRIGRVAAVTDKAIVVADTSNPRDGFTNLDYRSLGVTFDTLLDPVDAGAFGVPSDIDQNGRVILFFTHAVNQLTAPGSSSLATPGFFYERDLYPRTGTNGCAGSNVAEMFYLVVPDPNAVDGNVVNASDAEAWTANAIAHEYEHLINVSRRLYVNPQAAAPEELWLEEGLGDIGEELVFFRSSGLGPRADLNGAALNQASVSPAYQAFQMNNFSRFGLYYLQSNELEGPVSADPTAVDVATRGAAWNFLRFAADHQAGGVGGGGGGGGGDGDVWYRLVNSGRTGLENLQLVLGTDPLDLMRDWAISLYASDDAPGVDVRFRQPSWNLRDALVTVRPQVVPQYLPLVRSLADQRTTSILLSAEAVSFLRFTVPQGQDALLTVTSGGLPLPASVPVALVRVR